MDIESYKCKDCIHFDTCSNWIGISDESLAKYYCDNGCGDFSDKSEWVHLPCKVGDEIYYIGRGDLIGGVVDRIDTATALNLQKYWMEFTTKNHYPLYGLFGDTVFLTKEEAEKALAEREKAEKALV